MVSPTQQEVGGSGIPLGRSSYEFMVALVAASMIQMVPDWIAYTICWFVMAGVAVYFCYYSRGTVGYGGWRKFFLSLSSLIFIFSVAYSQVVNRYHEANIIPQATRYMTDYGGMPPFEPLRLEWAAQSGAPPRVVSGIPSGLVIVDGRLLDRYKKKFALMVVLFHIINEEPFMEKKGICKSEVFEIRPEDMHIRIDYNDQYLTEITMGATGGNFVLLAVPIGVKPEAFDTLNDAKKMGVQIIDHGATGGAPPMQVHQNLSTP